MTIDQAWEWYKDACLQTDGVYIIKNNDTSLYKIGVTKNIHNRFRQLELQSGCELELTDWYLLDTSNPLKAKDIEKKLHSQYKNFHIIGEWYDVDKHIDDLLSDFIKLCDNY